MFYKQRELRRLWDVEVYNGDPDDPENPDLSTRTESVIAMNAVDAIRRCGRCAKQPAAQCFVTWPNIMEKRIFRIENTAGPTEEVVEPSVRVPEPTKEEWQ